MRGFWRRHEKRAALGRGAPRAGAGSSPRPHPRKRTPPIRFVVFTPEPPPGRPHSRRLRPPPATSTGPAGSPSTPAGASTSPTTTTTGRRLHRLPRLRHPALGPRPPRRPLRSGARPGRRPLRRRLSRRGGEVRAEPLFGAGAPLDPVAGDRGRRRSAPPTGLRRPPGYVAVYDSAGYPGWTRRPAADRRSAASAKATASPSRPTEHRRLSLRRRRRRRRGQGLRPGGGRTADPGAVIDGDLPPGEGSAPCATPPSPWTG